MARIGKATFFVFFLVHTILSWLTISLCAGGGMLLLGSGNSEAPMSLRVVCLAATAFGLPLLSAYEILLSKLHLTSPVESLDWLLVPLNSLVAVALIYFLIRAVRRAVRKGI